MTSEEQQLPQLEELNDTELLELYRRDHGIRLKRLVTRERLIHLIESGDQPDTTEVADTLGSRQRLEVFIRDNWKYVNSQIPCKGLNRGVCTKYPCPDGRHLDCYLSNIRKFR